MRPDLGLSADDGPNDGSESGLCVFVVFVEWLGKEVRADVRQIWDQEQGNLLIILKTKLTQHSKRELHVTISQPNNRLFVGSIPKTKTKDEIFDEFHKHTTGLTEVILYYQVDEKTKNGQTNQQNGSVGAQTTSATSTTNNASNNGQKNRGFCFLEYDTHQAASQARRRLLSG